MYVIIVIIINIIRPHCVHTVHKIWPIGAYVAPLGWYQFILLDDMTYRCKQLAQGCYAAFASSRIWTHDLEEPWLDGAFKMLHAKGQFLGFSGPVKGIIQSSAEGVI